MVLLDELCLLVEVDADMPDAVALDLVADCRTVLRQIATELVQRQSAQSRWSVRIRLWDDID